MKKKSVHVSGILLSAGASTRLGQPKQLVKYNSLPLVTHMANIMNHTELDDFVIVTGAFVEQIQAVIPDGYQITNNIDWELGMGSTISTGTNYFMDITDGLLICLVDQYKVSVELLNTCLQTFRQHAEHIVLCDYGNKLLGPPAIFPKKYFSQLSDLSGDNGARQIISAIVRECPDDIIYINFPNGHFDIDHPKDLKRLI